MKQPQFTRSREVFDFDSFLKDDTPQIKRENNVKKENKLLKKLKLMWNLKKIKTVKKRINKELLKYYDLISYESTSYLNDLGKDKNYIQFLIKLTEYFKQIREDIYIYGSLESVNKKYKQNDKINIDLTYFLNKFFYNKENYSFDLNVVFNKYLNKIYRQF